MDIATLAGMGAGFGLVLFGTLVAGLTPLDLFNAPSILITVGGGLSATIISNPITRLVNLTNFTKYAFSPVSYDLPQIILQMVAFAERARREGLLSLEDDVANLDDPFIKKGIQLVVDGTDPELVRSILDSDMQNIHTRHEDNAKFWGDLGFFLPAFGMLGTLIGLIQMLKNLGSGDPTAIGEGMAAALITTLYGSLFSNIVALPLKGKLMVRDSEEMIVKSVMIEGILSIQSGDNPRIVKDKLASFVPPSERAQLEEAGGG
ncbi:MAG: motility protein A [Spirochaetia bacterium]|nr:motility protein A [Spirochaetia bacterium]